MLLPASRFNLFLVFIFSKKMYFRFMGKPRGLPKSGGRKKGSKNKVSNSKFEKICQIQRLASFDPLEALFAIGSDLTVPIELRVSSRSRIPCQAISRLSSASLD